MRAIIQRDPFLDECAFGKLYLPWIKTQPDIYTLERPWKNNESYESCIPSGVYTCMPHVTDKGRATWQVTKVPGRFGINFDIANYPGELEGCIAFGFGINEVAHMITKSEMALNYLLTTIGIKTTFELEIRNAPGS